MKKNGYLYDLMLICLYLVCIAGCVVLLTWACVRIIGGLLGAVVGVVGYSVILTLFGRKITNIARPKESKLTDQKL